MLLQLKSEFRKLFSVRSTYILLTIATLLIGLFSYFGTSSATYETARCEATGEVLYTQGYEDKRLQTMPPEEICGGKVTYTTEGNKDLSKEKLLFGMQETIPLAVTFASIILILLVAHEFRYNTINYSLTISNSRSKVLLAKVFVAIGFTILVTLFALGVNIAVSLLAISIKDLNLPAQDYNWWYVLARHLGYAVSFTLFFVGAAVLVRNLVAAVAALFVLPMIDGIAGFLLSTRDIEPTKVLPFSAIDRFGNVTVDVTGATASMGETLGGAGTQPAAALSALAVFAAYLVVLWAITWYLFLRRDAN